MKQWYQINENKINGAESTFIEENSSNEKEQELNGPRHTVYRHAIVPINQLNVNVQPRGLLNIQDNNNQPAVDLMQYNFIISETRLDGAINVNNPDSTYKNKIAIEFKKMGYLLNINTDLAGQINFNNNTQTIRNQLDRISSINGIGRYQVGNELKYIVTLGNSMPNPMLNLNVHNRENFNYVYKFLQLVLPIQMQYVVLYYMQNTDPPNMSNIDRDRIKQINDIYVNKVQEQEVNNVVDGVTYNYRLNQIVPLEDQDFSNIRNILINCDNQLFQYAAASYDFIYNVIYNMNNATINNRLSLLEGTSNYSPRSKMTILNELENYFVNNMKSLGYNPVYDFNQNRTILYVRQPVENKLSNFRISNYEYPYLPNPNVPEKFLLYNYMAGYNRIKIRELDVLLNMGIIWINQFNPIYKAYSNDGGNYENTGLNQGSNQTIKDIDKKMDEEYGIVGLKVKKKKMKMTYNSKMEEELKELDNINKRKDQFNLPINRNYFKWGDFKTSIESFTVRMDPVSYAQFISGANLNFVFLKENITITHKVYYQLSEHI